LKIDLGKSKTDKNHYYDAGNLFYMAEKFWAMLKYSAMLFFFSKGVRI